MSYLPPSEPITEIDESILDNLVTLNFLASNEPQYLDSAREELLSNKRTQLVVVYNLLLQQKREKQKQKEKEQELERKAEVRKKEAETPERQPNTRSGPASLASSSVAATTTKKKTKKSIVITSRGEATPEKHKKKSPATKKAILSPLDKVVNSSRQRSNSLSNDGKSQYDEDDDDYSTDEEGDQQDSEHDTSSEDIEELQEHLSASSANPTLDALNANRQRSASMSPHNPRPVIDFDELIAGKLTPVRNVHKKRSQTPQKIKRPVLSEELFIPPEGLKEVAESSKVNHLSEVQGSMNLVPDNISSKPLDQIVEEVVRVLNKEEIKHRKRKHKFIWKCSAEISNEPVQLELEIMNVKNNMYGIMARRIQGSFPTYQVLYNRIKKGLDI
jgi:hypothetical protein